MAFFRIFIISCPLSNSALVLQTTKGHIRFFFLDVFNMLIVLVSWCCQDNFLVLIKLKIDYFNNLNRKGAENWGRHFVPLHQTTSKSPWWGKNPLLIIHQLDKWVEDKTASHGLMTMSSSIYIFMHKWRDIMMHLGGTVDLTDLTNIFNKELK